MALTRKSTKYSLRKRKPGQLNFKEILNSTNSTLNSSIKKSTKINRNLTLKKKQKTQTDNRKTSTTKSRQKLNTKSTEKQNKTRQTLAPVYINNVIITPPKTKATDDLYEFSDSDLDSEKPQIKRRRMNKEDPSFLLEVKKPIKNNRTQKVKKHAFVKKRPTKQKPIKTKNVKLVNPTASIKIPETVSRVSEVPKQIINNQMQAEIDKPQKELIPCIKAKTPNRINILSNYILNSSIQSPSNFTDEQPDANSTMVNNVLLTPWRFNNYNIRRNPHYIQIKSSALPNVNQEMVIDYTNVQKFNVCSKTPKRIEESEKSRKNVQKTLTDFYEGNQSNQENLSFSVSLFGVDELSPIKKSPTKNVPLNQITKENRQIFGDITNSKSNEGVESLFGFNSLLSSECDNREKENRPFRLSIKANDRKYQRKKVVNVEIEEELCASEIEEECEEGQSSKELQLFDDFDNNKTIIDETTDIGEEIKLATKKQRKEKKKIKAVKEKNILTNEEEEEFSRWAKAFNAMCKEVEDFPLEIE